MGKLLGLAHLRAPASLLFAAVARPHREDSLVAPADCNRVAGGRRARADTRGLLGTRDWYYGDIAGERFTIVLVLTGWGIGTEGRTMAFACPGSRTGESAFLFGSRIGVRPNPRISVDSGRWTIPEGRTNILHQGAHCGR